MTRPLAPWVRAGVLAVGALLLVPGASSAQDDDATVSEGEASTDEGGEGAEGAEAAEPEAKAEEVSEEGLNLTLEDRIKAVSRKTFIKAGRVAAVPMIGASTNDAFYQHFGVGGRLSWHLVDSLAIDVGGLYFPPEPVGTIELPAHELVRQQYGAFAEVANKYGFADIGITFSPIYGKLAILGDWIIHFDGFVSAAIGAGFDSNVYNVFGQTLPEWFPGINPAAEVGIGGRIFVFRWMTLRFDLRDYVYPQYRSGVVSLQSLVMVQAGIGFYFPFDFDYEYAAARVVDDG